MAVTTFINVPFDATALDSYFNHFQSIRTKVHSHVLCFYSSSESVCCNLSNFADAFTKKLLCNLVNYLSESRMFLRRGGRLHTLVALEYFACMKVCD